MGCSCSGLLHPAGPSGFWGHWWWPGPLMAPVPVQARASMQAEMVLKEAEAERQRKRILELEDMQERLQEALQQEVKARQDEEAVRYAQAR